MEFKHLIWVGAGNAVIPAFDFQEFDRVTLVDARQSVLDRLQVRLKSFGHVNYVRAVIAGHSGEGVFYGIKPERLSRFGNVDALSALYPNLTIESKFEIEVKSLLELLKIVCDDGQVISLLIDLPNINELSIFQNLNSIMHYDIRSLYVYYDDDNFERSIKDFELVGKTKGGIDNNYLHYFRDPKIQVLEKEIQELKKTNSKLLEVVDVKLEQRNNEFLSMISTNNALHQNELSLINDKFRDVTESILPSKFDFLKKLISDLEKSTGNSIELCRNELIQNSQSTLKKIQVGENSTNAAIRKIVDSLKKLVDTQSLFQNDLKKNITLAIDEMVNINKLDETLSELVDKITLQLTNEYSVIDSKLVEMAAELKSILETHNAEKLNEQDNEVSRVIRNIPYFLQKNSFNISKQIESFFYLNKYLSEHQMPLNFHGWPISPDIGLVLVEHIENKAIDAVIEFGSGTSSVILAKSFRLANSEFGTWSLKKPIISFEHNQEYLEKTSLLLESHNCREIVDLVHAPLIDFKYKDNDNFLYYDCQETIKNLSLSFDKSKKNILVLIDGPPGVTNKNARFPALPILLNHLSNHKLFVVMDDYNRDDEKETFILWEELVESCSLSHISQVVETEKGLSILTIN